MGWELHQHSQHCSIWPWKLLLFTKSKCFTYLCGCHNIVGDQKVVSVGDKLNLGIQEEISHQDKWILLLNYSGILVMATNNTNSDYYSVQQNDSLLVESLKFPKISWNSVSKEHGKSFTIDFTPQKMWDLDINTGNCLTKVTEDNLCPARLSFPKQLWRFAASSGMSKVLEIGGIWAVFPKPINLLLTQMTTAVAPVSELGWCLQLTLSPKDIRERLKASVKSRITKILQHLKEWHGFNPCEHPRIKSSSWYCLFLREVKVLLLHST